MPNKHSHAFVLSNYAAQGLTHFDDLRVPRPQSKYATSSERPSNTNDVSTSQYHSISSSPPPTPLQRIRLQSHSPPPLPSNGPYAAPPHQHTDINFTRVTQLHLPEGALPSTEVTEKNRRRSCNLDEVGATSQRLVLMPSRNIESREKIEKQIQIPPGTVSYQMVASADDRIHVGLEGHDARGLHSPRPLSNVQRRQSNETAVFPSEDPSSSLPTVNRRSLIETSAPAYLRHPPSPPLMPENRQSFSLNKSLDSSPFLSTNTAAESSIVRVSDRISERSPRSWPSTSLSPNASRSKTPTRATLRRSSRSVSIVAHNSSLKATALPDFDSSSSQASSTSIEIPTSLEDLNSIKETKLSAEPLFFTDVESLPKHSAEFGEADPPSELPSEVDYDILPWEDVRYNAMPTDLCRPSSPSVSTRASSSDSAAPPPIGLNRFDGPLPDQSNPRDFLPDRSRPGPPSAVPKTEPPKLQKLARKSLSSIFHSRSRTPISIPYQTTIPGRQPARVSVSRTSVPSIPTLFPNYKGPWPREEIPVKAANPQRASSFGASPVTRTSIKAISAVPPAGPAEAVAAPTALDAVAPPATTFRQNGPAPKSSMRLPPKILSDGPAPFAQTTPLCRDKSVSPLVAGSRRSGTAAREAAQRRKSWFNTDTWDYAFGGRESRRARRGSEVAPGLM